MGFPRLQLKSLTREDIRFYEMNQLRSHARFQQLESHQNSRTDALVNSNSDKASGVYLWVRIIVRELLKGLVDGDDLDVLHERVRTTPADLFAYFRSLLQTVPVEQQKEASIMFQIALYKERDFASVHSIRLIDRSFVNHGCPDFLLTRTRSVRIDDILDNMLLSFRMDSTARQLSS